MNRQFLVVTRDRIILLLIGGLALLLAGVVAVTGHTIWYSDSYDFTIFARLLPSGVIHTIGGWRPPGYPILLILSGYLISHSFSGIIILQALAAAMIPVMGYLILKPVNVTIAAITGLCLAASLIPFCFVTVIYPDQLFISGLVAVTLLTVRCVLQPTRGAIYAFAGLCLGLVWLRPAGAIVAGTAFVMIGLQRRLLPHLIIAAVLAIAAQQSVARWQFSLQPIHQPMLGKQLFWNAYLHSGGMNLSENAGRELRRQMINFLSVPSNVESAYTGADHYLKHYRELRSRYADNPERMVDGMLAEPTTPNYWFMVPMPIEDRLFRVASIAHYKSHPIDALLALLGRYKGYVLGPPWHYQDDEHLQDASHFESMQPRRSIAIPAEHGTAPAWQRPAGPRWQAVINNAFDDMCRYAVPISFVLMLVGVFGLATVPGTARTTALIVFILHEANVAIHTILVEPQLRYQLQSVPLAMIGAGLGLYVIAGLARSAVRRARLTA